METGSNNYGYYHKYADGTLEMWGVQAVSNVPITSDGAGGGKIYNSTQRTIYFPVESKTTAATVVQFTSTTGAWASAATGGNYKKSANYWLYYPTMLTVSGATHFHALGTWK